MSNQKYENLINEDLHDIDDDDHLNSSHKITATVFKPTLSQHVENSPNSNTNQLDNFNIDIQNLMKNDLQKFVNTLTPKDYFDFVHCHVKREREGLTKGLSTVFSLYFNEENENDETFLLIARKHLNISGHSEYFIGIDKENPSNLNDENSIAKLSGMNITGTEYILYDHQDSSNNQKQSAAIIYDEHIFRAKELRKFRVVLCDNEKNSEPLKEKETIIDQYKSGNSSNLIELKNTEPIYDEESEAHILNFYGNRVKEPSQKNFQLITSNEDGQNNVAMQFGRIDENNFALDYRYPLTAIQAFAIALSAFHSRART
jgi:tubby-related protein 1